MAEVIHTLPSPGGRSPLHALFEQVSDGQVWKVPPEDLHGHSPKKVRASLQAWARSRCLRSHTRLDREGNLYVHMEPEATDAHD